jgi:hypothetical protein
MSRHGSGSLGRSDVRVGFGGRFGSGHGAWGDDDE